LLGIAAAVKLTPLIFIPVLLLTRQFRAAATALASFLLCSAAAFAVAPHSSLFYWSHKIFERAASLIYISDQNLHSALQRMLGAPPIPILLDSLTLLFAVGGLAVATWAYRTSSQVLGILLCAATGLIISPVSWAHHYVWIVPVLAWLALGRDRPHGARWWALGVAALFWTAPIWWVPGPQSGYGGPLVLLAGNSFFLAAVVFILLATGLLWSRGQARTAHGDSVLDVPTGTAATALASPLNDGIRAPGGPFARYLHGSLRRLLRPVGALDDVDEVGALEAGDEPL
jgi:alpha-1,2-mannosyltransferase